MSKFFTLIKKTMELNVVSGKEKIHLQVINEHEGSENFPKFILTFSFKYMV